MNIFEGIWGSKKEPISEENEVITVEEETASVAKTIESIQEAKESLAELSEKRQEVLEKHRDTTEQLASLGVHEIEKDGHARTETYNEVLNPIEAELSAISNEVGEKRAEFDLEPSRVTMLESRIRRLEELKVREEAQFAETEVGKQIAQCDDEIQRLTEEMAELGNKRLSGGLSLGDEEVFHQKEKERNQINQKRSALYRDDKIANTHALRLQRIKELSTTTYWTKTNAEDASYDENGQMRIK